MAPLAETVMLLAAVVEQEIVPEPATVSAPVLAIAIVAPDLDEVRVPAFVNVLPLTFMVMLAVEATVVLELIEVATDVVVVSPPLPGLILIVPPLPNVSVCPE